MKKALFFCGGWKGHEPQETCALFSGLLKGEGYETEVTERLEDLEDEAKLAAQDLLVMCVTMGEITGEQVKGLSKAVAGGIGFGGWHGGFCDAFRKNTEYQFMTGGQFVAHPGNAGVTYPVHIRDRFHPITTGIENFEITSEQYYMHVDPAINVLATTVFDGQHSREAAGVVMPVVWTKSWGKGRVFHCALGHVAKDFEVKEARQLVVNGLKWATR